MVNGAKIRRWTDASKSSEAGQPPGVGQETFRMRCLPGRWTDKSSRVTGCALLAGQGVSWMLARIEACIPALRRYASALLRDQQEADDLVHSCLSRALDELHTPRGDGDIRVWLFAIMHHLLVSQRHDARARAGAKAFDDTSGSSSTISGEQKNTLQWSNTMSH
jgi:Sigma-70 region 2